MTLRKLSAAVLALSLSSGALAAPGDTSNTNLTLTVNSFASIYTTDSITLAEGSTAGVYEGTIFICAESNFGTNAVEVTTAAFELVDGSSNAVPYTLDSVNNIGAVNAILAGLTFGAAGDCNTTATTGDFDLAVSADASGAVQGTYNETIVFTIIAS
jgi:hypothetical protein